MKEYIELSELQKFCREYTEVDAVGLILAGRTDLLHTADVVERSKIDKAIKEIKGQFYILLKDETSIVEELWWNNALEKTLEILKRTIGE